MTLSPADTSNLAERAAEPVVAAVKQRPAVAERSTRPSTVAYLLDSDSEGVVRRSLADLGLTDGKIEAGDIDTAIAKLGRGPWPRLLIVDVGNIEDLLARINRLAELCDPRTEVVVIGERNDVRLYRDLKAAGVAEYFYKPLVSSVLNRSLAGLVAGDRVTSSSRSGKLVSVLSVRGGAGATTVAVNAAWYLAMSHSRRTVLLDLDLQGGDTMLLLDAQPNHALREALAQPGRIDDLFLERGVTNLTPRLALLAALEPLAGHADLNEEAVMQLVQKLLLHYRYVFIDLPWEGALWVPKLLHLPGLVVLVSTGSLACARDLMRWRERIGPNTPERSLLHLLNKSGGKDMLPRDELLRIIGTEPEISIPYDAKIEAATNLGVKALQECSAIRHGMEALAQHLTGAPAAETASLWQRVFG